MTTLPKGWSKTRVLITGPSNSNKFTVPLRYPITHVAFATVVSVQGAEAILQVDGLNGNQLSTIDSRGDQYHFDFLASNLNNELQYALYTPPVLPYSPQTSINITQISVTLLDVYGAPFSVSGVVSIEFDCWSYLPDRKSSGAL